jgi:hypothetical protein
MIRGQLKQSAWPLSANEENCKNTISANEKTKIDKGKSASLQITKKSKKQP